MKRNESRSLQITTADLIFRMKTWLSAWESMERYHCDIKKDPVYIERKGLLDAAINRLAYYYDLLIDLFDSETKQ